MKKPNKIMISDREMAYAAGRALKQCLGLADSEKLLIVANPEKDRIARVLYNEGLKICSDAAMLFYPPGKLNGEEPPAVVSEAMLKADVVVAATVTSITHTRARKKACRAGTRIASMPGITEEIFVRGLSADYDEISRLSSELFKKLDPAAVAHITSPSGCDLVLDIKNRAVISDGIIKARGNCSNLPGGETELAPRTGDGILVADRCGTFITEPTKLEIKNGYITKFQGSPSGKRFNRLINESMKIDGNTNASFIAEFAIGTNKNAKVSGVILEDEKVYGTCHIAFGNNTSYPGGKNNSTLHIDVIILKPTIALDGKTIMRKGKLVN